MRVLVATASEHGATRESGAQLGPDFDAVILGSTAHLRQRLKPATKLVDRSVCPSPYDSQSRPHTHRMATIAIWTRSRRGQTVSVTT